MVRKWAFMLIGICGVSLSSGCCQTAAKESSADRGDRQNYFAIFFEGKKCGYGLSERTECPDKIISLDEAYISFKRAGVPVNIRMSATCFETPDGKPLGFESVQEFSFMSMVVKGTIKDNQLNVTMTSGPATQKRQLPWSEGTLLAEGVRQLMNRQEMVAGKEIKARVFDPMSLTACDCHMVIGSTEQVDLLGQTVPLTRVDMTMKLPDSFGLLGQKPSSLEVDSVLYVDQQFNTMKEIQTVAGITVEMIACDKSFALSENNAPDFIDQIVIPSPVSLDNVDPSSAIRYHLTPKNSQPLPLFKDDNQQVESDGAGGLYITVKPVSAPKGISLPYNGNDPEALESLKANRFLQSDSDIIQSLARQAIGQTTDAATAAYKIESFVHDYIQKKNMSVGYASAVEIAQSRQGDCTEHAVLTAALCRAVGLPARIAVGYVYVDRFQDRHAVFGGHAWTQAYIGDRWVGLDATRAPNGYSTRHLTLLTGSGNPEDFLSLLYFQNRFQIKEIVVNPK